MSAIDLPAGDILHVHNVVVDPFENGYWVLVGDYDRQPGIGLLSKDLRTLEWLGRGSQHLRAVAAIVERDCLIYGMDSNCERNFICRIDKQSGKIADSVRIGRKFVLRSRVWSRASHLHGVEPNPACPSRECSLYASRNGADWTRWPFTGKIASSRSIFISGTLVLPYSPLSAAARHVQRAGRRADRRPGAVLRV